MGTAGAFLKRLIPFAITAVLVQTCAGPLAAADKNTLTLLATHYPPYEMEDPVEGLSGFDHDVVIEAFARTGWRANIVFVPWNRAVAEVRAGNVAGVLSCAYRAQREEFAFYSEQLSSSTDGVFFRRSQPEADISAHTDLAGRKVGAVSGYTTHAKLADFGIDPIDVPDDEAGIRMLDIGRLDYFYNGRQATEFLVKQLGLSGRFDFATISDKPLFLCLSKAFPNSETILRDFNRGLAAVKADGTYAMIHARYK